MKHGRLIDADALKEYFFRPYSNEESYSNIDIGHIIDDQPTVNSSAQPNLQPTSNQLATDTIIRQAAINAIIAKLDAIDHVPQWVFDELTGAIGDLPSAQPERKTGQLKYESAYNWFRCNVCRKIYPSEFMQYFDSCQYQPGFNFCPNCGADMRGEQDG